MRKRKKANDGFELKPLDNKPQSLIKSERKPLNRPINTNPWASLVPSDEEKEKIDISSFLTLGLSAADALIPGKPIKNPVVQPGYSYNPNAYGTGSQMLMEDGGKLPKRKQILKSPGKTLVKITPSIPVIDPVQQITPIPQPPKNKRNWHYAGAMGAVWDQNGVRLTEDEYKRVMNGEQVIPKMNKGGKLLSAKKGLYIENDSYSHISPTMLELQGNYHEDGGTDIAYMGRKVEAEKGEPITLDKDGNLTIFGNMKNPLTGNKYKKDAKILAEKETKAAKFITKGNETIQSADTKSRFGIFKQNAGKVMLEGGKQKYDEIQQSKEHLGDLQNAHLQLIGEEDHTAENGKRMYPDGGKWKFDKTNTSKLDKKILDFVKMVEDKGYTGRSGEASGYSNRKTKSGHKSRHAANEALDMIFDDKDAYNKILNDKDLTQYLVNNGLTALNEYDPNVANKTGATVGHLHIGYDYGTKTADQFRNDAFSRYGKDNPNWGWQNRVQYGKGSKSVNYNPNTATSGDVYYEPIKSEYAPNTPVNTPHDWEENPIQPVNYRTNREFNFNTPQRKSFSNAKGVDPLDFMGEVYSVATNQQEPVFMQQYQPDLFTPYKVSFQDRINNNNRTFNAIQQLQSYNPEALSQMASEVYSANNQVSADEFRTNQAIADDITNKNISLLNDAKLKNLQLADNQYSRQEQAKSNTKAVNQAALNSISSKVLQTKAENNRLRVMENLYPNYRFDPNTYEKVYTGPSAAESIDWGSTLQPYSDKTVTVRKDPQGNIKSTTEKKDDAATQIIKQNKADESIKDKIQSNVRFLNVFNKKR